MHHPHSHSNMSHDKKATDRNKQAIYQYCKDCYSPDQALYPIKRPTLAEFAFEFYKLQARVHRTKKLWNIIHINDNVPTPFTYMYEPDGSLQTGLFDVPLQCWAKPRLIHKCMYCLKFSHSQCWYMPLCGRCKVARYCSHDCFKRGWKEHKKDCGVRKKLHNFHDLFHSMATAIKDATRHSQSWAQTPFFEASCADEYGERLQIRPIRFTPALNRCLPNLPREVLMDMLKPPYKI